MVQQGKCAPTNRDYNNGHDSYQQPGRNGAPGGSAGLLWKL